LGRRSTRAIVTPLLPRAGSGEVIVFVKELFVTYLDCNTYETGIKVSDEELAAVQLEKEAFHGDWNYTISPK